MKQRSEHRRHHDASVLVGLLWCLALLSVVVIGVLHTARLDLQVAKNIGDSVQARYLALAGIEKAKALLYEDAKERRRTARHHSGALSDAPDKFRAIALGRGQFSVIRQGGPSESRGIIYGISDEESRLNLNRATPAELAKIRDITPDVMAAIQDWRDGDNSVTAGGAEADYYSSLQLPALPRNGPFETVQELLLVRGFPRRLFLGEDANQNGLLDRAEDDGAASPPADNRDGVLDAGWSGLLTVNSSVSDQNAAGEDRLDLKSADERALTAIPRISAEIARAIVAYRGQNQFESLADLLEVSAPAPPGGSGRSETSPPGAGQGSPQPPGAPGPRTTRGVRVPPGQGAPPPATSSGPKLITPELLMEIADDLTLTGEDQSGAVNVNTASAEVLACLPGITPEIAQAIVAYRRSAGFLPNVAWLLKVDGINPALLKQLWPKVTVRSETFRIVGEGSIPSTGARHRIEMIVRLNDGSFETLSYREDL